ncbi:MAG: hypothetical protein ACOYNC_00975 [Bacteroidales bacterium]
MKYIIIVNWKWKITTDYFEIDECRIIHGCNFKKSDDGIKAFVNYVNEQLNTNEDAEFLIFCHGKPNDISKGDLNIESSKIQYVNFSNGNEDHIYSNDEKKTGILPNDEEFITLKNAPKDELTRRFDLTWEHFRETIAKTKLKKDIINTFSGLAIDLQRLTELPSNENEKFFKKIKEIYSETVINEFKLTWERILSDAEKCKIILPFNPTIIMAEITKQVTYKDFLQLSLSERNFFKYMFEYMN